MLLLVLSDSTLVRGDLDLFEINEYTGLGGSRRTPWVSGEHVEHATETWVCGGEQFMLVKPAFSHSRFFWFDNKGANTLRKCILGLSRVEIYNRIELCVNEYQGVSYYVLSVGKTPTTKVRVHRTGHVVFG